jgi:hypothetical protein
VLPGVLRSDEVIFMLVVRVGVDVSLHLSFFSGLCFARRFRRALFLFSGGGYSYVEAAVALGLVGYVGRFCGILWCSGCSCDICFHYFISV